MFQKLFLPAAFYIIFVKEHAGEDFIDDEVLQRIIAIEREHLLTRDQQSIAQNPLAQDIRQSIEQHLL